MQFVPVRKPGTPLVEDMSGSGTYVSRPSVSNRIMVVDDEEIVLSALRETLRRQNYEVTATADPTAALQELRDDSFAVIIADQRMPVMSGLELLNLARQIQPNATRILMAGVVSLDTVIDAINTGEIYRFIVKPWLREELLVTIKNAVQRHELVQQNLHLQTATMMMNGQLVELNHSLEEQVKLVARQNQQLARMNQTLEQNLMRSMELSLQAVETFYPTLGEQGRFVAQLCRPMAQLQGLSAADCRVLESAALLHDIGLVGTPRSVIRRWRDNPRGLNHSERVLIEQHPILGQELSAFGDGLEQVGTLIRVHHERVDGGGYPDRLAGDKIPWLGKLLAVAVAFASSKIVREDAIEEIKMQANAAFDADAVRVFLRALPLVHAPRKEKQVPISDLRPGMVLARGIYAPNGLLLAPEGQPLNNNYIEKLLNQDRIQPINQSLVVYC
ncbi:MAG: HD domain-containing phosphohydrolase [Limisphaerales bacterium]